MCIINYQGCCNFLDNYMNPSKNATDQKKLKLAAPFQTKRLRQAILSGKGSWVPPESDGNDRLTPMLWKTKQTVSFEWGEFDGRQQR